MPRRTKVATTTVTSESPLVQPLEIPPHEHYFVPLDKPYEKMSDYVEGSGVPAAKSYVMVYCTRCTDTKELVCADYGVAPAPRGER